MVGLVHTVVVPLVTMAILWKIRMRGGRFRVELSGARVVLARSFVEYNERKDQLDQIPPVALSLRNRDARDSDARHFADRHLEQEIQQLEGLTVPVGQRPRGIHGVMFSVELNREVDS